MNDVKQIMIFFINKISFYPSTIKFVLYFHIYEHVYNSKCKIEMNYIEGNKDLQQFLLI